MSNGRALASSVFSCVSEDREGLARLLSLLGVRGLVWERAGRVAGCIVELTAWRTRWGWGVVDSIEKSRMYSFQELRTYFASIRRGQPLQKRANFVSSPLV
jgi:hypothetical protein